MSLNITLFQQEVARKNQHFVQVLTKLAYHDQTSHKSLTDPSTSELITCSRTSPHYTWPPTFQASVKTLDPCKPSDASWTPPSASSNGGRWTCVLVSRNARWLHSFNSGWESSKPVYSVKGVWAFLSSHFTSIYPPACLCNFVCIRRVEVQWVACRSRFWHSIVLCHTSCSTMQTHHV